MCHVGTVLIKSLCQVVTLCTQLEGLVKITVECCHHKCTHFPSLDAVFTFLDIPVYHFCVCHICLLRHSSVEDSHLNLAYSHICLIPATKLNDFTSFFRLINVLVQNRSDRCLMTIWGLEDALNSKNEICVWISLSWEHIPRLSPDIDFFEPLPKNFASLHESGLQIFRWILVLEVHKTSCKLCIVFDLI